MLNYELLKATPLNEQPFPFFVQRESIIDANIGAVVDGFPPIDRPGSLPVAQLSGSAEFHALISELEGDKFRLLMQHKFEIDLENRPVVITARGQMRPKDGRVHTDSHTKILTVLMYFNTSWEHEGGRLRLLNSGSDLEQYAAEIEPLAGTMLAFKVTDNCWHGHLPVQGKRLSLQLNYLSNEHARTRHTLTHTLSSRVKALFARD